MAIRSFGFMSFKLKHLLEEDGQQMSEDQIKEMEKEIELYDFLAKRDHDDLYTICNSGAFNDIFMGYLQLVIDDLATCDNAEKAAAAKLIKADLIRNMDSIFDFYGAEDAEKKYLDNQ